MSLDERLTRAAHHVADGVVVPDVDLAAVRSRARTKRRATLAAAGAAVAVAAVMTGLALLGAPDRTEPTPVDPEPKVVVPQVPVWYDDAGLHHGRRVDPTPVDLLGTKAQEQDSSGGVLTLVRTGALYRDPATDDVWWHPWRGKPRVVGEDSATGPGGDPHGDVAAWFEGDELVVWDTVRDRVLSRTSQAEVAAPYMSEHLASGYGFQHVSAEEVVWRAEDEAGQVVVQRLDLATGQVSVLFQTSMYEDETRLLEDVHGDTRVWADTGDVISLTARYPGGETVAPAGVEATGRLNAEGKFLLRRPTPTARTAPP